MNQYQNRFPMKEKVKINKKKSPLKEFDLAGEAEPEVDIQDISTDTKIIYTKMLRYAKMNRVSSLRAQDLVDDVLNLYFYFVDGGYPMRERMIFKKIIIFLKKRIGR